MTGCAVLCHNNTPWVQYEAKSIFRGKKSLDQTNHPEFYLIYIIIVSCSIHPLHKVTEPHWQPQYPALSVRSH